MDPKTNYREDSLSKLTSVFSQAVVTRALLAAYARGVQRLEDGVHLSAASYLLGSAVGVQLDALGGLVGEVRGGRQDDDFRTAIRVRVITNASRGQTRDLQAIIRLLFPAGAGYREDYPASVYVTVSGATGAAVRALFAALTMAKAGGVGLVVDGATATPNTLWRAGWTTGSYGRGFSWSDLTYQSGMTLAFSA